jgi:transposase InsO family protein
MNYSQSEKMEIIRIVEQSSLSIRKTLEIIKVNRSSFYQWYHRYQEGGYEGLAYQKKRQRYFWNRIPEEQRKTIVETAKTHPEKSCREIAWFITDTKGFYVSESSVYRILKEYDLIAAPVYTMVPAQEKFHHPPQRVNELWQTDFTYLKVKRWGWYYLSTVMDDFSRYIVSWKLCTTMSADDVKDTLDLALENTGVDTITVQHRPRLLSDNGPAYISRDLRHYLEEQGIDHTRGKPFHPMTQGKIERYHRSMKNLVLLDHYYSPEELERRIEEWVKYYNEKRYHEAIDNVTPKDKYDGLDNEIRERRKKVKRQTIRQRRCLNKSREVLQL